MARGIVYIDGIDDVLGDFNRIVGDIEVETRKALEETLSSIELKMKSNAITMLDKGYATGRMANSISHHIGKNKEGVITSSVGVYYDGVKDLKRRVNAPVLAMMYEAGIRPHSTSSGSKLAHKSGTKEKNQTTGKKGIFHSGSPPIPFMSSAMDAGSIEIFENLKKHLNNSIDR